MYEVPSFGRAYFEATAIDHAVVVGIGGAGIRFLDASDPDRAILGEYDFEAIESFTCPSEVRGDYQKDSKEVENVVSAFFPMGEHNPKCVVIQCHC